MRGVRISYLIEHPEYVPQLAQGLFQQWDFIRSEKNPETRIEELREQMLRVEKAFRRGTAVKMASIRAPKSKEA
jgi:hypothetical protein